MRAVTPCPPYPPEHGKSPAHMKSNTIKQTGSRRFRRASAARVLCASCLCVERALRKARCWTSRVFGSCWLACIMSSQPSKKYASQFTYAKEFICTSVSMHWVMACHTSGMHPVCSLEQMDTIMQHGLRRHRAVRAHCEVGEDGKDSEEGPSYWSGLLQTHEVLKCCPLPPRFVHRELHGCVGRDADPEVREYCVALHELGRLLKSITDSTGSATSAGVLFTARAHTSALFAGPHGLFHFDSAVAEVRELRGSEISAMLRIAHKLKMGDEYTVVLVQTRPA